MEQGAKEVPIEPLLVRPAGQVTEPFVRVPDPVGAKMHRQQSHPSATFIRPRLQSGRGLALRRQSPHPIACCLEESMQRAPRVQGRRQHVTRYVRSTPSPCENAQVVVR